MKKYLANFKKTDPLLYTAARSLSKNDLLDIQQGVSKRTRLGALYADICWAIIGQQLSGKAAETIFARFKKLCGTVTPERVQTLHIATLRSVGISNAKGLAITDLTKRTLVGMLPVNRFQKMSNEEIMNTLVDIRGIGPWTAQMVLMFSLNREDVFSPGDLGLQMACKSVYKLRLVPSRDTMERISLPWSPYRSIAARILWKHYDAQKKKTPRTL